MTGPPNPGRWLAAALVALALATGAVAAQSDADPVGHADAARLACGIVDTETTESNAYYVDLCAAFSYALGVSDLHVTIGTDERVLEGLAAGTVDVALGLPWEGTGAAPVRHGPVVLITPSGRFGIAAPRGNDRLLETVSWLFHALVEAEARGIDRAAVRSELQGVPDATAQGFRDYERRLTEQLELDPWALREMLLFRGHHGEIYRAWFDDGADVNRPVELGGQLFAPPVDGP